MATTTDKKQKSSSVSKELKKEDIWNDAKIAKVKDYILAESKKQSPQRRLRNEFLSIKYLMEDYIAKDEIDQEMQIIDFVRLYLKLLNITQKELAAGFEMKDTNLYKYLIGERKLNSDIVLKLSYFSHTQPELWYRIQIKNELDKKKEKIKEYKKYDYKKLVSAHH